MYINLMYITEFANINYSFRERIMVEGLDPGNLSWQLLPKPKTLLHHDTDNSLCVLRRTTRGKNNIFHEIEHIIVAI